MQAHLTVPGAIVRWKTRNKNYHYGIYVGRDPLGEPRFIHNSKRERRVVEEGLGGFSGNRDVEVHRLPPRGHSRRIVRRAHRMLGSNYDLLFNNCEHLVNWVYFGKRQSQQLQDMVGKVMMGAGLGALVLTALGSGASSRETWTDAHGYRRDSLGRFA